MLTTICHVHVVLLVKKCFPPKWVRQLKSNVSNFYKFHLLSTIIIFVFEDILIWIKYFDCCLRKMERKEGEAREKRRNEWYMEWTTGGFSGFGLFVIKAMDNSQ